MKRLTTIALITCSCQIACAAEWASFATSPDGDISYLDTKSIKQKGNKRIAWAMVEKAVAVPYQGGLLKSHVVQIEVDCKARTQRAITEIGHQPDGSSLYQFQEQEKAVPVVPDSMGEMRLEALCKFSLKKS